jgi:thiol-disulfide isomerase/thioredoxin
VLLLLLLLLLLNDVQCQPVFDETITLDSDYSKCIYRTLTYYICVASNFQNLFMSSSSSSWHYFRALLGANPDKLIVMKFTASYCRACQAMNPRFESLVNDPSQYVSNTNTNNDNDNNSKMPILWADFAASPSTKDYFRRLGVLSLPTVHFYDGPNGLVENFPCGKTKIPVLKMKLQLFQMKRVDQKTGKLIVEDASSLSSSSSSASSSASSATAPSSSSSFTTTHYETTMPRVVRKCVLEMS